MANENKSSKDSAVSVYELKYKFDLFNSGYSNVYLSDIKRLITIYYKRATDKVKVTTKTIDVNSAQQVIVPMLGNGLEIVGMRVRAAVNIDDAQLSVVTDEHFFPVFESGSTFMVTLSSMLLDQINNVNTADRRVDMIMNIINNTIFDLYEPNHNISGGHVIFGGSGSGKSTLIDNLRDKVPEVTYIESGEPTASSHKTYVGLVMLLASLITTQNSVIAMDSLRGLIYSSSGSTLSGGISSNLIEGIATISTIAAASGNDAILVVNPLTNDVSKAEMLTEALKGSATSLIILDADFSKCDVTSRNFGNRDVMSVDRASLWSKLLMLDNGNLENPITETTKIAVKGAAVTIIDKSASGDVYYDPINYTYMSLF